MPKYEVIIYWSQEDDAFIAEIPELPGCAADGKTYREALTNVEVVIRGLKRQRNLAAQFLRLRAV
jgi:predicted RNase H-like HicB family nuclease